MKRAFYLTICLLTTVMLAAQTQQGYVKTKGRLGSNGTVIKGTRLAGATITIKGHNSVLSGSNGTFTLTISGNNYYLQSVQKQGYVVSDPDILTRQYSYSKNPLVLVLETQEQHTGDKLEVARKLYRTMERKLQEKEDEIVSLKAHNKLSEAEYHRQLEEVFNAREKNKQLIDEMAERYSRIDYDQVDEFNARISRYILDGELKKADSLLQTKGDINIRIAGLRQLQEHNAREEKTLEKKKEVARKELEDIAHDCYSKFEIFKMNHQNDSAAYYIVQRADLDTLDIYFQNDAANFLSEYMARYDDALAIYERMLNVSEKKFGINSSMTAMCNNNIGAFFLSLGHYKSAINYLTKALEIYEALGDDYLKFVGTCESNIGAAYDRQQDYALALQHLCRAKDILTQLSGEDGDELAEVYNSMGLCYYNQRDYQKAEEYYAKAKVIWMRIYGENSYEISVSNNNMAGVLTAKGENDEALQLYSKVLDYRKKEFGNRHPVLGITYYNISAVYLSKQEFDSAYQYCQRATELWKEAYGEINPIVADGYGNMAEILYNKNDWQGSLKLFRKAYEIALQTRGPDKPSTRDLLTNIDYTMGRMDKTSNNDSLHAEWLSFIRDKVYIANVPQTEASPAYQLGMSGEYVILEYEDWSIDKDYTMLFTNEQLRGKPKTLVFMKDDTIQCHHFENVIGVQFYLKTVGEDKKAGIIDSYRKWKRNGR